jgi:hypothetical protein
LYASSNCGIATSTVGLGQIDDHRLHFAERAS